MFPGDSRGNSINSGDVSGRFPEKFRILRGKIEENSTKNPELSEKCLFFFSAGLSDICRSVGLSVSSLARAPPLMHD